MIWTAFERVTGYNPDGTPARRRDGYYCGEFTIQRDAKRRDWIVYLSGELIDYARTLKGAKARAEKAAAK